VLCEKKEVDADANTQIFASPDTIAVEVKDIRGLGYVLMDKMFLPVGSVNDISKDQDVIARDATVVWYIKKTQ